MQLNYEFDRQLELERADAREDGYEEGREAGMKDGMEAGMKAGVEASEHMLMLAIKMGYLNLMSEHHLVWVFQ